jgi:hypothetical protein
MEKLIALLFLSRDQMHVFHLKSKSYAEHMILNEYYTDIVEDADALAEVWQGKYGKLLTIPKMNSEPKGTALDTLRMHAEWVEKNRYKECDKDDAVMQALVDTTLHTIYSTCYKLQNLQ